MKTTDKLVDIWLTPCKNAPSLEEQLSRNDELYRTLDEANYIADHYLLIDDTCKISNPWNGCKVTKLTFKQGRGHDITTAYLISDLENVGQEAIEQTTGELLIKIPDEYKEILLNKYGQEGRNYHNIKYPYSPYWHGIKNTLAKILDNKIRCLEIDYFYKRINYVESCN